MRAIAEAQAARIKAGGTPKAEIMIPLAASVMELHLVKDEADAILAKVAEEQGVELDIPVGAMIELPRAALHRRPDGRRRRVLLVRHQRPDPDHVGLLA